MRRKYDHDLIARMIKRGTSTRDICAQVGCSEKVIYDVKREIYGPGKSTLEGLDERLALASQMVADECSIDEIARTVHMAKQTIREYFPRAGWTNEQSLEFARLIKHGGAPSKTIRPGDGDPRHGQNGYSNLKCRCEICKAWQSEYARKRHGGTAPKNPGKYDVARSTGNGLKTRDMLALEKSLGLSYDD